MEKETTPSPYCNTKLPVPAGVTNVGLRVTDDQGASDEMYALIVSDEDGQAEWTVRQVSDFEAGSSSMTMVQDRPAISYLQTYGTYSHALMYLRAEDIFGDTWPAPTS